MVFATYYYNRTGKQSNASHTLTFVTILTVFEFFVLMIEPYVDEFSGGVPVFKLVMNILLAISLDPAEKFIRSTMMSKPTTEKQAQ